MNLPTTLQQSIDYFTRESRSINTRRAYAADCRVFGNWCAVRGFQAFPCGPSTVAAFVADQARSGASSIATLSRRLAAIARVHEAKHWPNPIDSSVREVLAGARRSVAECPKGATPLMPDQVRTIIENIDTVSLAGFRDRAIILVGFAGALRRSELRGLCVEHIERRPLGAVLTIPRSKTDQEAEGQQIALLRASNAALEPVSALFAWLDKAGISSGPVFREVYRGSCSRKIFGRPAIGDAPLSEHAISQIIKRRVRLAGIDPSNISAHSLRAGALTAGALSGASTWKLRELSRHKSLSSLSRYVRPVALFEDHALAKVL